MKNPFKLKNVISSATAIALGGAGNVAMDYAFKNISFLQTLGENGSTTPDTTKNAIKVAVGAVGGSLVPTKYGWLKSALDGTAIVGASELISSLINDTLPGEAPSEAPAGLPRGTIGRISPRRGVKMGQKGFRKVSGVAGNTASSFMAD